jgi:hypothetical protein
MVNFVFILEDKDDVDFMRDFLIVNYCNGNQKCCSGKNNKKEREKNIELLNGLKIKIITTSHEEGQTGGWSKIKNLIGSPTLEKLRLLNPETIFISFLDGDENKEDNIEKKEKEILETLKEVNKDGGKFQLIRYYIPYNNDKSINLEQLLHLCKTKPFDSCWEDLEKCLVHEKIESDIHLKGKMITYKEYYNQFKNKSHQYLSEIWNIEEKENKNLTPLKEFLDNYLI